MEWNGDEAREVHADLAKAHATGASVQLDFALRKLTNEGSMQAEPVARLEITPKLARQMLTIINRLLVDLQSGGRQR
jgi:hypothetical protein